MKPAQIRSCLCLASIALVAAGASLAACSSAGSSDGDTGKPPVIIADNGTFTTLDGTPIGGDGQGDLGPGPDVGGPPGCTTDVDCPVGAPYCGVTKLCFECLDATHCDAGSVCTNGVCVPASCTPGQTSCNGQTQLTCNAAGTGWDPFFCVGGQCVGGACQGCTPNQKLCKGTTTVMQCRPDGSTYDQLQVCGGDQVCTQGACTSCFPGQRRCVGEVAEACSDQGAWAFAEDCSVAGESCAAGTCVSPCSGDIKFKSNSGCDYWAIDMDNHVQAQDSPFAVIVSNLSTTKSIVTITVKDDPASSPYQVGKEEVAPGDLQIFQLPRREPDGPRLGWNAFRIQSTAPIIAYQFNPLDNVDVFSNDASLLIPANTYGTEYLAISRRQFVGGLDVPPGKTCSSYCGGIPGGSCLSDGTDTICTAPYRGEITVVAPQAGTTVTVTPSGRTLAGNGMAVMNAGAAYQYTLEPYEALNIKSDQDGSDLTGTVIASDKPVGVFSGHEAAVSSTECCADHLEQQMFPTKTWGKSYLATKSFARGVEKDYWRFIAAESGTVLTFEPASVSAPRTLDRGEWVEIATKSDFLVSSDKPFATAQYLASSQEILTTREGSPCTVDQDCHPGYGCVQVSFTQRVCLSPECPEAGKATGCPGGHTCTCFSPQQCYCQAIGDPALISIAPTEQFRKDYVFLSPDKYQDDYINVVAPDGASVVLDGTTIPGGNFEAIGATGFRVARMKVPDGVHRLSSTMPVGVVAYGYDKDVSYGYTAGLNLSDL
ncbi:MAG: IgGFc-binding protein [Deltaproteobacteria bacterium]|nr:IgGFc-binding protein [Deltaproteobacteria bacterium]MCB9788389.1 IgGFc-binding protein [Deltaproteobacteria bacterium]